MERKKFSIPLSVQISFAAIIISCVAGYLNESIFMMMFGAAAAGFVIGSFAAYKSAVKEWNKEVDRQELEKQKIEQPAQA